RADMRPNSAARAGATLIAGFHGHSPPPELLEALEAGLLAGVVLFRRNFDTCDEAMALNREITAHAEKAGTAPPIIAVDQEGGRVARLGSPLLRLPPMRALASIGDTDLCRRAGQALGRQLAGLGFSLNFAPVLDVDSNSKNPVIGDR